MSSLPANSYDLIPYHFGSHPDTHPDRLATLATLFGLNPAPVDRCRVLELGCASGGNLLPMAYAHPDSQFLGIDYSQSQVNTGWKYIHALDLANLNLVCQDILDFDEAQGEFDYIIAHGLYSWVSPALQDKVLSIIQRCLGPQGVVYLSYNTLPGWSLKKELRAMILYQLGDSRDPNERYRQALEWLDFLSRESKPLEESAYSAYLSQLIASLRERATSGRGINYWYHEYLDDFNTPFYFHQVVAAAERHGLRYLADSDLALMYPNEFSPEVSARLVERSSGLVDLEQQLDFMRNRSFRQSLFVRAEAGRIDRPTSAQVGRLLLRCSLKSVGSASPSPGDSLQAFEGAGEFTLRIDSPLQKAAVTYLAGSYPRYVAFSAVLEAARAALGGVDFSPAEIEELAFMFYTLATYFGRRVEFCTWQPPVVARVGERPTASPVARLMAATGTSVTNLRHESLTMDETSRFTLWCLDGSRDRADVLAMFKEAWSNNLLKLPGCQSPEDFDKSKQALLDGIEQRIQRFATLDLLVE